MRRSLAARLERAWYPPGGAAVLPPLALRAAGALYALAARARGAAYDRGLLAARALPVPCISIGNLSVGGTGKTPLAAWVAGELLALGARPAVVSRGYGGCERGPALVPGEGGAAVAARFGDEPALLAARLPGVPVVVGRDRHAAGLFAARACGATIVVADDAFQHRRLARDLDVVALDASRGVGNGRCLPAGPLREPPAALARAGCVVLTRAAEGRDLEALLDGASRLAPRAILAVADLAFDGWRDALAGTPAELPPGAGIYAFSGVGNPGSFRGTLERQGVRVAGWEVFPDHHRYGAAEVARIAREAERRGAVAAVTTAKDAVRLSSWPGPVPLYRAVVKIAMMRGREQLWEALRSLAAGARG